jgi:HK97 family phage portal protein
MLKEIRDFVTSFSFPDNFLGFWGSAPSEAGVTVNEMSAMQSAAVAACIRIIAGGIASMPIHIYAVDLEQGSQKIAHDHSLEYLLNDCPNPETDAFMFKETIQTHLLIAGNAFIEKAYDKGGRLAALYQRSPFRTWPYRTEKDMVIEGEAIPPGTLIFKTTDGMENGRERIILADNMIHLRGLSLDGLIGLNPIKTLMREVIGLDIGARAFGARLFANNGTPSGVMTTDKLLKPESRKKLEESWRAGHTGSQAHKFAVLDGGLKWQSISISPEESQFLLTRGFQRNEIGAMFGVPSHMLGDKEDTKATIEQQQLAFLNFTLKPWMRRWESTFNMTLLPTTGRTAGTYRIKFDTREMERGDFETMLKAIATGRQWGIYSENDGKALLGINPSTEPNANRTMMPVNMVYSDADNAGEPPAKPAPGAAQPGQGNVQPSETKAIQLYSRVFRDAFGRILTRKSPDTKVFNQAFGPSLFGIADYFCMETNPDFRSGNELPANLTSFVADYIGGMQKRAGDWTADKADEQSQAELQRAVTAIQSAVKE